MIDMYEKHEMSILRFDEQNVFATAWFGSDIDGDAEDEFSLKPNRADI